MGVTLRDLKLFRAKTLVLGLQFGLCWGSVKPKYCGSLLLYTELNGLNSGWSFGRKDDLESSSILTACFEEHLDLSEIWLAVKETTNATDDPAQRASETRFMSLMSE